MNRPRVEVVTRSFAYSDTDCRIQSGRVYGQHITPSQRVLNFKNIGYHETNCRSMES